MVAENIVIARAGYDYATANFKPFRLGTAYDSKPLCRTERQHGDGDGKVRPQE